MAIVTRYFSTSSAGDADGTTWAKRAALLDGSGYFSSVITGFDFTSNSLLCLIGPGTYTVGQNFTSALFSVNTPTIPSPLIFHGCDSTGAQLTPPKNGWQSAEPEWDMTGVPVLSFGGSYYGTLANFFVYHINISGSRAGYILPSLMGGSWCKFSTTSSSTSGYVLSTVANPLTNCIIDASGASAFVYIAIPGTPLINCKLVGPGVSTGSGTRDGVYGTAGYDIINCTISDIGGHGVSIAAATATRRMEIINTTIANCGGSGINLANSASPITSRSGIYNCMITGCGAYGVNANSQMAAIVKDCRMRNNTSGNTPAGLGNYPDYLNIDTSAGTDANEYVDPASYDYRIKSSSHLWGKGYGAGEAPNLQRFSQRLRA